MTEPDSDTLGQGLIFEDSIPLQWHAQAESPTLSEVSGLNEANEEVMRFIDVLDEYPSEPGDEHVPLSQDLARVESKLNLLLGLVGQLMTVHFPLPPMKPVKLSPIGIEWLADDQLQPGGYGLVEIYLNARCPRSLCLPGQLERVESANGGLLMVVKFLELSEVLQEHLEKIIFRHHRRKIAQARRRASPDPDPLP